MGLLPSGHGPAERRTVHVSLRPYAGEKAVQLRFHFVADWGYFWSVDDVYVGTRDLAPVSGALAVGTVRERGTGTGLTGATVADPRYPAAVAVTTPTPEDPAIGDGFYTLFVASPGKGGSKVTLRAGAPGHTDAESRTTVRKDDAVRQDFRLTSADPQPSRHAASRRRPRPVFDTMDGPGVAKRLRARPCFRAAVRPMTLGPRRPDAAGQRGRMGVEPGGLAGQVVALGEVRRLVCGLGVQPCRCHRVAVALVEVRRHGGVAGQ